MQNKKELKPIPVKIIAYKCPVCTAILYVKTPDENIATFTPKGVIRHVSQKVYPALPEGLVFTLKGSDYFSIILDEGRMMQGIGGSLINRCDERDLAHSYEHEIGLYDVENKSFFRETHSWMRFSKNIRNGLGKDVRLLTIDEFSKLQEEFKSLKKDPRKYEKSHISEHHVRYFLSLDKLIRTTPELEKLVGGL